MATTAETLKAISAAPSRRDLWRLALDYFHDRGATMVSYHAVDADASPIAIAADGFPEHWVDRYIERDFIRIDPIPELAARLAKPFFWQEIEDLVPPTPQHRQYLDEMGRAGLGDGVAFYVFGPALQNAYVGLGFGVPRLDLGPEAVFELQCVAQAGHLRFCALSASAALPIRLSDREREVLEWVARGKSNSVIADIIGISSHTVDAHMRSIYRKLAVNDRTSAAVKALGSGRVNYPA